MAAVLPIAIFAFRMFFLDKHFAKEKQISNNKGLLRSWTEKNAEGEKISFGGVLSLVLAKTEEGEWVIQSHIWNMQP